MIATIIMLFDEHIERFGVIPNVVFFNKADFDRFYDECPHMSNDSNLYFGFDIVVSEHVDSPKVGVHPAKAA